MSLKTYDTFIMGHLSLDEIVYQGVTDKLLGGAVLYSSYSAVAGGHSVGVLTKLARQDLDLLNAFNVLPEDVNHVLSPVTTSIRNKFSSIDRERRTCTALAVADPFQMEDIPAVESRIYHFAGLIAGEFPAALIVEIAKRGKVAVDVQGMLRTVENGGLLVFRDWPDKQRYLPFIDFLKTDAAEAQIMTDLNDRRQAARLLYEWGAKEVMITHCSEVLVYDGQAYYSVPLKPRNLSGRTGRGDTCFSAYITERLRRDIPEALLYAAALVSLKMETPGPFRGTRRDVEEYIRQFYEQTVYAKRGGCR